MRQTAKHAFLPGFVRWAALVLAALMLCSAASRPPQAAEWMEPYLEQVRDWGIMRGDSNGNMNEDRAITRAEFVTLVNRAFGYTDVGENPFSDVEPGDWYAEDINIAYNAGYFQGTSPNTAAPLNLVTREQAAVLLGRSLRLQGVTGAANSTFTDMQDIGGWSRGIVQECTDMGIIQGYADGTFRPHELITRGQMACFLVRALGTLVQEPGEQIAGGVYGNLTITTPGVKLTDTTVTGNLYLTGGVSLGDVELENVDVLGKIVVVGGGRAEKGEHSIVLRNVTAPSLEVDSLTGQFLSVHAEGLTDINTVTVRTPSFLEDLTEDGIGFQNIRLDGDAEFEDGVQLQLAGNIKNVINLTPNSALQITQGVTSKLTVDERAIDSTLTIDDKATVKEVNLDLGIEVDGPGSIGHLNVNAPDSKVSILPDTIFVRPGVTGNIHGQDMNNIQAAESSEEPRLLAGYPYAKNVAPTSAEAVFKTNKAGTVHWAITALMDGSLGEEELMNPGNYAAKIVRSGTVAAAASNTEYTARLTGLTRQGSYYISALVEDARGHRSPVKTAAFTTPDDSVPAFANGYPQTPVITTDADGEQIAQIMVMPTKDCQMYYALLPSGSVAPTAADFRAAAIPGNLGYGMVTLRKNTPFLVSRINSAHLAEQTQYDLYLWLNDADNGKSSAVRKITFTTRDLTPPTIQRLEVTTTAERTVTLTFELDEPGALSWFVTPRDTSVGVNKESPTRQDQIMIESAMADGVRILRRGGPVRFTRVGTAVNFTVSGLEGQTPYDLYYMAKDNAGNYCVYNKAIEFPLPIKTQDTAGPTVEVTFSLADQNEGSDVVTPHVDSDITLQFSETVRGAYKENGVDVYDEFQELYNKVLSSASGETMAQAKNNLAKALHSYISLYPGNPPTRGDPQVDEVEYTGDGHTLTDEQKETLPAWIDYREAIVSQSGSKTSITFPGANSKNEQSGTTPAIKLQSGGSYYFRLEGIEDTSFNPMKAPTNLVYTPKFNMAYATIYLDELKDELSATYLDASGNSVTKNAKVFSLKPDGTEAVPAGTRWDMLIWTKFNMKYDLLIRESGSTMWTLLGDMRPNPDSKNNPRVFNSLNGNHLNQLLDSGIVGTVKPGEGYPMLREFNRDLEFAIVPEDNSFTTAVSLDVQIYVGTNADIKAIARVQGNASTLSGQALTSINEPEPFTLTFAAPDRTPTVYVPVDGANVQSSIADIQVRVDAAGTVYYFAIPLSGVGGAAPSGTSYALGEEEPWRNNAKLNLDEVPVAGVDRDPVKLDETHPDAFNVASENPNISSPNSTLFGNTEGRLLGTSRGDVLHLKDLLPETTYLLYLVPASPEGTPARNVQCYKFTTGPAMPPVITVRPSGTTGATILVSPRANVNYILVDTKSTGSLNNPFNQTFDGSNGLRPLPANWTGGTILKAMLTTYSGTNYTVFDLCADPILKANIQEIITKEYTGTFVDPPPADTGGRPNVDTTGLITFRNMQGSNYYVLLIVAEDESGNLGFRAHQTFYNADVSYLYVVSKSLSNPRGKEGEPYKGTITITFSDSLYYRGTDGNDEIISPVDGCYFDSPSSGTHATNDDGLSPNGFKRFQNIMDTDYLVLKSPQKGQHDDKLRHALTFDVEGEVYEDVQLINFYPEICDHNGRVRQSRPPLIIYLRSKPIPNTDEKMWEVEVPDTWLSATGR